VNERKKYLSFTYVHSQKIKVNFKAYNYFHKIFINIVRMVKKNDHFIIHGRPSLVSSRIISIHYTIYCGKMDRNDTDRNQRRPSLISFHWQNDKKKKRVKVPF